METKRSGRGWRPGPDTAIALVALVLGAGGVGWAATRDASSPGQINACANNASGALRLNTSGTCDAAGETPISWSEQGPQGPQGEIGAQGPPGANATATPAIAGHLTQSFKNTFFVSMEIATPGTYLVQGTVAANAPSTDSWLRNHVLTCRLLQYPDGQQSAATLLAQFTQTFRENLATKLVSPESFKQQIALQGFVTLDAPPNSGSSTTTTPQSIDVGLWCFMSQALRPAWTPITFTNPQLTAQREFLVNAPLTVQKVVKGP